MTDASAYAFQEWNVIKKNRFGRKQERVFGIDGKRVYNSKRGQRNGVVYGTGVLRAEREITNIKNVEILRADLKTFRIKWIDDKDTYDIDYTCENTRHAAEIVAKINYLLSKSRR